MTVLFMLLLLLLLLLVILEVVIPYKLNDLSLEDLKGQASSLQGRFALSSTAQLLYHLPESVSKHNLRFQKAGVTGVEGAKRDNRCSPIVLRLSDTSTLFKDPTRPQVLISGEVHGNERVGPIASISAASLLIWGAKCEIQAHEQSCVQLEALNISTSERSWLTQLATTRDTYILPAANCMGYLKNTREDVGVDPNRDFSYSRSNGRCFQSLAAKTFRALFSRSLIQITTTFHGGMEALGYLWGTTDKMKRPSDKCPDHNSHHHIASILSKYAGGFERSPPYKYDTMNAIVYPVEVYT